MDDRATSVIVEETTDQASPPENLTKPASTPPGRRGRSGFGLLLGGLVIAAAAGGAYAYLERGHSKAAPIGGGPGQHGKDDQAGGTPESEAAQGMRVDVVHAKQGGLERKITQVCAVHSFERAQLYAKISGFLMTQGVDIGDKVKKDQILAEIFVPEVHKAVDQATAALDQTKALVTVAEAKIRSAQSLKKASDAMLAQRQAEVAAKTAFREYREKQKERIRGLVARNAVEEKLLDEAIDQFEAAVGDERASQAAVLTAQADQASKQALVEEAQADLIEAKANQEVAQSNLEKAQVMADYTKITSPYDGVITLRSFHRGDFIRSAAEGGNVPVLAVARTDLMRVVIPVPDREVPFVTKGDKATILVDALPGRTFDGAVSRFAESEDPQNRAMRTEVDLRNNDGKLGDGMYGTATILLERASPTAVTVPSSSLLKSGGGGAGEIYIVRDGKAKKIDVRIGMDNGNLAEVLNGLSAQEQVITRYSGALSDGMPVIVESAEPTPAGKSSRK